MASSLFSLCCFCYLLPHYCFLFPAPLSLLSPFFPILLSGIPAPLFILRSPLLFQLLPPYFKFQNPSPLFAQLLLISVLFPPVCYWLPFSSLACVVFVHFCNKLFIIVSIYVRESRGELAVRWAVSVSREIHNWICYSKTNVVHGGYGHGLARHGLRHEVIGLKEVDVVDMQLSTVNRAMRCCGLKGVDVGRDVIMAESMQGLKHRGLLGLHGRV